MRLIFLVHRTNYYKFYGPLVTAALARNWQVECWLCQDADPSKSYLMPTRENLPFDADRVEIKILSGNSAIQEALKGAKADAVFSLHPRSRYLDAKTSLPRFITLQHGIDTFIEATAEELASSDMLCLYAPYWAEWGARFYETKSDASFGELHKLLLSNSVFAGFPQMDVNAQIDPAEVRTRFGIPADKAVVLLLPITLANKNGIWPRFFAAPNRLTQFLVWLDGLKREGVPFALAHWPWVLSGWNDRALTRAIAQFCEGNDAMLVAKGRQKDRLRSWLEETADIALYDEKQYPATILEMLAIADVCIHFYSFAALESADAGVYGITIDRPSPAVTYADRPPAYHQLWRRKEKGSAFNFEGVNTLMSIPEAIRRLPGLKIADLQVSPAQRETYVAQFLGSTDHRASERVLDLIN
jgi:hypothetical protein